MEGLLLGAAVLAASAVFIAVLAIQPTLGSTRRLVQQRTMASGGPLAGEYRTINVPITHLPNLSARAHKIAFDLERAGLNLTVAEFMITRSTAGAAIAIGGFLLVSSFEVSYLFSSVVATLGFLMGQYLPVSYLHGRAARRLRVVEDQVLDALVSVARSMRTGLSFPQALEYAGREVGEPLGPELQRVLSELQLGAELDVVFEEMNGRIGSSDLEIASTAILIQRRVGGNLSEILMNVANTIRERKTIRNELHALTSRHRLQGNLSALIPVVVALLFFALNPEIARRLFETTAGQISLTIGILFELLGLWMVRRFGEIEV